VQRLQIDGGGCWPGSSRGPEHPGSSFEQLRLPLRDLIGMDIKQLRQFASVLSPLMAARATFDLNTGVWFRRGRLLIVSPVRQPYWPLSGRNSTYPAVQILEAISAPTEWPEVGACVPP